MFSCDVVEADTSLLSDYIPCIDSDYRYVEPVLALRTAMANALLQRAVLKLNEKSSNMTSQELSACRDHITLLFQTVTDTLIQQVQLAINANRFEVSNRLTLYYTMHVDEVFYMFVLLCVHVCIPYIQHKSLSFRLLNWPCLH